jgi:hypothetical protein
MWKWMEGRGGDEKKRTEKIRGINGLDMDR